MRRTLVLVHRYGMSEETAWAVGLRVEWPDGFSMRYIVCDELSEESARRVGDALRRFGYPVPFQVVEER